MTPSGWKDPQPGLQLLRATFPHWAFLYDPFAFRWVAVLGKHLTLSAGTPNNSPNASATASATTPQAPTMATAEHRDALPGLPADYHGAHVGTRTAGHEPVQWHRIHGTPEKARVIAHTCECKATIYELCNRGGGHYIRRTTEAPPHRPTKQPPASANTPNTSGNASCAAKPDRPTDPRSQQSQDRRMRTFSTFSRTAG
ncbi:MAG: hypothetical protein JWL58_7245 [Streptosporangiaceae bacterium]|nr:hypothetical protein [Streptosporangiaceae bacterium]